VARYDTISFMSDYGRVDEFVGVVHSVIRSIAPDVAVIDITHDVARHDVRGAGLLLARAAQYLVPGVVLAVVDPGVGGARRRIAVEVGGGVSVLVGPDNGLLAPAVALVGGADRAVEVTTDAFHLPAPGPTFDGRDVFGPVAAHLATGVDIGEFGPPLNPATLVPAVVPVTRTEDDGVHAEVLWVDTFGNVQLNVDPVELDDMGERVAVATGGTTTVCRRCDAYADIGPGAVGVVVDSYGMASLAAHRASAAEALGVTSGAEVVLSAATDDVSVTTTVELGRRS
jgi:S-adenosylmethionine hydrolase